MPKEKRFQIGDYYLSKRTRSPFHQATWYDKESGQTRRVSLGTADFQEAQLKLAKFVTTHAVYKHEQVAEMPIPTLLLRYWHDHGSKIASKDQAQSGLNYWNDYWKEAVVADLTPNHQRAFIKSLKDRGFKNSYVSRIMSVGRAALNHGYKEQMIASVPFIFDIADRSDEKEGYVLEPDQLSKLLLAAQSPPHLHTFCMISLNTMARPDAVLDLRPSQVNFAGGFIELNPKGRVQTKKYRPIVPIPKTILPYIQSVEVDRFVNYRGKSVASITKSFNQAVKRAGLPREITPYSLRHTMSTLLGQRNVPNMQIDTMLGHSIEGTKKNYIHFKPDYLIEAKQAIENYLSKLGVTETHILPASVPPTCHSKPDSFAPIGEAFDLKAKMVGGIGIEPTTTTMST